MLCALISTLPVGLFIDLVGGALLLVVCDSWDSGGNTGVGLGGATAPPTATPPAMAVEDANDDGWSLPLPEVGGLFMEEMTTFVFFFFGAMTIFGWDDNMV